MSRPEDSSGWTSEAIVEAYLGFFRDRGHLELPSSSLVPEDDPTVLLTTAGMQQMIPYMLARAEPPSRRLCSIQKCFQRVQESSSRFGRLKPRISCSCTSGRTIARWGST